MKLHFGEKGKRGYKTGYKLFTLINVPVTNYCKKQNKSRVMWQSNGQSEGSYFFIRNYELKGLLRVSCSVLSDSLQPHGL